MPDSADTVLQLANGYRCMSAPDRDAALVYLVSVIAEGNTPGSSSSTGYAGVSALRVETTHNGGSQPSIAYLCYISTLGDSGQGMFMWDTTESADDDGINVIRADDNPFPALGAWIRLS